MEPRPSTWDPAQLQAHAPWIRSLALRLVRDAARADDLVQEAFLAALEQRPATDRSLRPWFRGVLVKRIAYGVRSDERRRARERERAPNEEQPSSRDLAEEAETHARLVQSLARLREPYRTALLLRYYEGLAPKEIARRLDMPAATVRSHLKRGLAELRGRLDGEPPDERRAWCVALAPLAAAAPGAGAFTNPLTAFLEPLRAMHPLVHVIAASSLLLITGTFVAGRLDGEAPAVLSPAAPGVAAGMHATAAATNGARAAGPGELNSAYSAADERIVGFVRERETDAPVREYALRLRVESEEGLGELLWTDEAGRFESVGNYPAGAELIVSLIDHPELRTVTCTARDVRQTSHSVGTDRIWQPTEGPLELSAKVGPTFTLALDAPFEIELSQLVAILKASEREPFGPLSISHQLRSPVRAGEPLWTRFDWILHHIPKDRPWLLRVETTDGLWAGAAEVAASEDKTPETIAIELAPAARLDVVVVSETEYHDLVVRAERIADGVSKTLWRMSGEELADGRYEAHFQLMALPAGAYQLTVSSEGADEVAGNAQLVAGEVYEETIELTAGPALSHVRGELHSLSGLYAEQMTLYLTGLATGTVATRIASWEERDGVHVAPFVFDNLPADSYTLSLFSFSDYLRWDGSATVVSPPEDEFVLTCRDTDLVRRIEIHAKDVTTGEAIPTAWASMTAAGCATSQMGLGGGGRSIFLKVPADAAIEWFAVADGFVPAFGDENALVVEGEMGTIEATLQPGWGARLQLSDAATELPLAGVRVKLDDMLAGTTDSDGRLDLSADAAPTHVDIELSGWQFSAGAYDPLSRTLTGILPTHEIQLGETQ